MHACDGLNIPRGEGHGGETAQWLAALINSCFLTADLARSYSYSAMRGGVACHKNHCVRKTKQSGLDWSTIYVLTLRSGLPLVPDSLTGSQSPPSFLCPPPPHTLNILNGLFMGFVHTGCGTRVHKKLPLLELESLEFLGEKHSWQEFQVPDFDLQVLERKRLDEVQLRRG